MDTRKYSWLRTLTLGATLLGSSLLGSCKKSSAASAGQAAVKTANPASQPVVVVTSPKKADAKQRLRLPGTLEPWERAKLFAKVSGYVSEIGVEIGDQVKKGQVLARLSLPEMAAERRKASADVPAAKAQVEKAKADAELAKVTGERLAKLQQREPGAISEQELDVAGAKKKAADAQVQALESGLDVAKAKVGEIGALMSYATIKAPFDGTVTRRNADIGALVTQAAKEPIVEVSRVEKLRLVLDLPEAVVPYVKPAQKVEFSLDAMPGKTFSATVARMSGVLAPDTRSMRVEIDVDNARRELSAGMYVKVELGYRELPDALTLPATSIRSTEGASHVLVVAAGDVLKKVPVTLLMDDGVEVVVTGKELDAATRVVLVAPPGVEVGAVVSVREQAVAQDKK